jgi:alpha,alpha-trehalase
VEYGALYGAEELGRLFSDSKTAADLIPKTPPAQIVAAYDADAHRPDFSLMRFVAQYFTQPMHSDSGYVSPPQQSVVEHIDALWPVLRRDPDVSSRHCHVAEAVA